MHVHRAAEEAFYVTAGELAVYADGRWSEVPAGSFVLIPRGTRHALGNASADPVHWLMFISPATHAEWVLAEHELIVAAGGNAPTRRRWPRSTAATAWTSSAARLPPPALSQRPTPTAPTSRDREL